MRNRAGKMPGYVYQVRNDLAFFSFNPVISSTGSFRSFNYTIQHTVQAVSGSLYKGGITFSYAANGFPGF